MSRSFSCKRGVSRPIISSVSRKLFLGIRINPELKKTLEEIAATEERSVSQICELLLRKGVGAYKKGGTHYLKRSGSLQKKEGPSE